MEVRGMKYVKVKEKGDEAGGHGEADNERKGALYKFDSKQSDVDRDPPAEAIQ